MSYIILLNEKAFHLGVDFGLIIGLLGALFFYLRWMKRRK